MGLNETCQRLERELENLKKPQQNLRIETMRERASARQVMRYQRSRVMDMERKVAERKLRLIKIDKENSRYTTWHKQYYISFIVRFRKVSVEHSCMHGYIQCGVGYSRLGS